MSKARRAMKLAGSLGLLFLCFTVGVSTAPWELPPIEPLTSKPLSVMLTTHDSLTTVKSFYLAEGHLIVGVSHNREFQRVSALGCLLACASHSPTHVATLHHHCTFYYVMSLSQYTAKAWGPVFSKAIILFKGTLKT